MSNVSIFAEKNLLDWCLLGASPARPTALFIGCCLQVPTSESTFEVGNGSGYTRQRVTFSAASGGSAVLADRISFGPFVSAAVIRGIAVFDQSGNYWFGGPAPEYTVKPGDTINAADGSLTITLV